MDTKAVLQRLEQSSKLDQIRGIFPNHSIAYIDRILSKKHGSVEDTMDWLAAFDDEEHEMRVRIQALPQELQDTISDHVIFSAAPAATTTLPRRRTKKKESIIKITAQYKPPTSLQIDKNTRAQFARSYYGENIFEVDGTVVCLKWLQSIPGEHRGLVKGRCKRHLFASDRKNLQLYEVRKREIRRMVKMRVFRAVR